MDQKDSKRRIDAALVLLSETSTSKEKFNSIKDLLKGFNPKIDKLLHLTSEQLDTLEKLGEGAVIDLTLENLPEQTEEQKKRKKAFLLLLQFWKDLKSEVERVKNELEKAQQSGGSHVGAFGKILGLAKGPLGIITLIAVVAVVMLSLISVKVTIKNVGCEPLNVGILPIPLPGLSLPKDPIVSGGQGVATLPPLPVTVDGTTPGTVTVSSFGLSQSFQMGNYTVVANGIPLEGSKNTFNLIEKTEHEVVVSCR